MQLSEMVKMKEKINHGLDQCLCPVCSENAELVGQLLTLPRWVQIISARIKGLKSVTQRTGKNKH